MEQTHGSERINNFISSLPKNVRKVSDGIIRDVARDSYMAGIIDGEGSMSIGLYKIKRKDGSINNGFTIKIYVTTTDIALIDWLQDNFGGKVYDKLNDIGHLGTKICYRWQSLSKKEMRWIIDLIEPYLIIKKKQAQIIREFYDGFVNLNGVSEDVRIKEWERRLELRNKINKLNGGYNLKGGFYGREDI